MNKQKLLLVIAVAIILISGATLFKPTKTEAPAEITPIETATPPQMVGNDRDAHGCIGSAGYSWCEVKQKCLRVWEEKCEAEATSVPTPNETDATPINCPQFTPPAPGFCPDGKIVAGKSPDGCNLPPRCVR